MEDEPQLETARLGSTRPPSPPSRRAGMVVVAASGTLLVALVLALLVVGGVAPNPVPGIARFLAGPTPTPSIAAGGDAIVWPLPVTTVHIDGKLPTTTRFTSGSGTPYMEAHLVRGKHHVTFQSGPDTPVTCAVTVPAARDDTCPLIATNAAEAQVGTGASVRVLDTLPSYDKLPSAQTSAMLAAIGATQEFPIQGTINAGDHYLNAAGQVAVAGSQMTGQLIVTPIVRSVTNLCAYGIGACPPATPSDNGKYDMLVWELQPNMQIAWRYQPGGAMTPQLSMREGVQVTWQAGKWSVGAINPVLCDFGGTAAQDLWPGTLQGWACSADVTTNAVLTVQRVGPDGSVLGTVRLLYHYGVLLAVDASAHQLLPSLPVASGHEQAIAQSLAG